MWYSFYPTAADLPAPTVADAFKHWIESVVRCHGGQPVMEKNPPEGGPTQVYRGLFHKMYDSQKEGVMKE